jgi:3-carboxy-cis,cis-muconate cycloisomerase
LTSELFGAVFARGTAAEAVSGHAWLRAMLRVEAAIAKAAADVAAVSPEAAEAVAAAAKPEHFDLDAVAHSATRIGNPVAGIVDRLRELVPEPHREAVHYGATSQDIMDTATMLIAKEALSRIKHDYRRCVTAAAILQFDHEDLQAIGRTLLQHAEPIWFDSIPNSWAAILANAREPSNALGFRVSYSGAVGPGRHDDPLRARWNIARRLGEILELECEWPWWHTDRTPVVRIGAAAAEMAGACGKVAVDIILLSQNEIGEVSEGVGGGSTTMPHKHNPVAATAARACAARTPGLVATLYAAMPQELQRSPGLWHSEWETLTDLLRLTGSAAAWLRESLEGLQVHPEAMRRNLEGGTG